MALLELEPPFDVRDVQLARRRMAKRWHPDIAPPGKQHEHQRHLQAINDMADELERLAEGSRGGKISRNAARASAAAARQARAEEGQRAYEAEQRARAAAAERTHHDPFGSRVPDHSVVHRYARCSSYPEWGVGSVTGIYFTGDEDDVRQWARVLFQPGDPHGARRQPELRRLLDARPGCRPCRAVHDGGAERAVGRRLRARRAATDLRPRRGPGQRAGAAHDDARLLAGRQPAGGRARGARLGAGRRRPARGAPLRRPDLRGHGGDRSRRRGSRAGGRGARPATPASGRGSAACACA